MKTLLILLAACLMTTACLIAADEPAEKKITFDDHIKPIFREHCATCHSESDKESDLALDSFAGVLAGGSGGEVLAEGNAGSSRLFALLSHAERPFMPPDQDPIPKEQIALVKTWIEQGMPENSGSKIKRSSAAAAAMLGSVSTGKPEGPPPMPETLLTQPVVETPRSAAIAAMAASPWAPLVAVGGQEQVVLYHAESGELLGILPFPEGEPQSLTFTRDGRQLLIAGGRHSHSGCAVLVDIASGQRITKVGDELDTVLAADITPDKSRIALAGPQKVVRIYDSLSGDLIFEMKKHTDWIFALRYSPDGVLLASGDRSNGLIVWEADTGRLYSELNGHKGEVRSLDFRGDSNVLASGSLDGTIKLWDMVDSKEIKSWNAHGGGVSGLAYAHDGQIASAGQDAKVKLWNGNGELQKEFAGLGEAALEVALTGDAAQIAGGDWNGKVQIWQTADPQQTHLIASNPPSIESRLAAASETLHAAEQELSAAQQAAQQATALAQEAQTALAATQTAVTTSAAALESAQVAEVELAKQLESQTAEVAKLEALLAAARDKQNLLSGELSKAQSQVAELSTTLESQQPLLKQQQEQQTQLAAAAATATEQFEQDRARVAAATSELEKIRQEKAALASRAAEYEQAFAQATAQVTMLGEQLAQATEQDSQQQAANAQVLEQLNALRQQLAAIQQQVEQTAKLHEESQAKLVAGQTMLEKLQSELENAEQISSQAQQQLDLFRQAYQRPE